MLVDLEPERFLFIDHILMAVFNLDLAEYAFAQVLDGIPTRTAFKQTRGSYAEAPEIVNREEPTEIARTNFREFRQWLQPAFLAVDSQAVQTYQDAALFSDQFFFRLLRVVAHAVHSLGRVIYMCSNNRPVYHYTGFPHRPPDLRHPNYQAFQMDPYGVADGVGYWVETQIFGGIILFEHESSQSTSKVLLYLRTTKGAC